MVRPETSKVTATRIKPEMGYYDSVTIYDADMLEEGGITSLESVQDLFQGHFQENTVFGVRVYVKLDIDDVGDTDAHAYTTKSPTEEQQKLFDASVVMTNTFHR